MRPKPWPSPGPPPSRRPRPASTKKPETPSSSPLGEKGCCYFDGQQTRKVPASARRPGRYHRSRGFPYRLRHCLLKTRGFPSRRPRQGQPGILRRGGDLRGPSLRRTLRAASPFLTVQTRVQHMHGFHQVFQKLLFVGVQKHQGMVFAFRPGRPGVADRHAPRDPV